MGTAYAEVSIYYTPFGGSKISLGSSLETASAFIRTKPLHLGSQELVYFIDKLISNISNRKLQKTLVLNIYGSEDYDGPYDLLDSIRVADFDPQFTDPPGSRYYKFEWSDPTVADRWRLHSFEVYGEPGGDEY